MMTPVRAANAKDEAAAMGHAADYYKSRLGEPEIDADFVANVTKAFEDAAAKAVRAAAQLGGFAGDPAGRGRRSRSSGPVDVRDAIHRVVALILGNPEQKTDKESVYAGLRAYDGRQLAPKPPEIEVSEETINTFSAMHSWTPEQWAAYEQRMEARMATNIASEECADCRRFSVLAERRGWTERRCRSCRLPPVD